MTEWIVVMRFAVPAGSPIELPQDAAAAARLLGRFDGCRDVAVGRASDDPGLWVMTTRWESVGAYRRALADPEVKALATPFLATAIDEPSAFEVLFAVDRTGERSATGDLASDAGTVDRSR